MISDDEIDTRHVSVFKLFAAVIPERVKNCKVAIKTDFFKLVATKYLKMTIEKVVFRRLLHDNAHICRHYRQNSRFGSI